MGALGRDLLHDALSQLGGWSGDTHELRRTLEITESEHAALTEWAKIFSDALRLRPDIRRVDGRTHVRICDPDNGLTAREIALAARIEDAYQMLTRLEDHR